MQTLDISLKEGQAQVLDGLLKWEKSDEIEASLTGVAGTGKTTLINSYINRSSFKNRIGISAPTHKAKEVIISKIKSQAYTIQQLCGLKPNTELEEFTALNPIFSPISEPIMKNFKVVIIDECSMINSELHDFIINQANQFKVKILFIGDPLQLPPIKETISNTFLTKIRFNLTEIIRQEQENPINELIDALRYEIITRSNDEVTKELKRLVPKKFETFIEILKRKNHNIIQGIDTVDFTTVTQGYIGYENDKEFLNKSYEFFKDDKLNSNPDFVKYCGWTNQAIGSFNKGIINIIRGVENGGLIQKKDILMSYVTVADEDNIILYNSKDYIVDDINVVKEKVYDLKVFRCNLRTMINNRWINRIVDILHPESYNDYKAVFNIVYKNAVQYGKQNNWQKFFSFKNSIILVDTISNKGGDIYNKKPTDIIRTMDYAYGVTVHKLQGSTLDYVFINVRNINRNPNIVERLKLLYVAVSRAKNCAFLYY